MTTTRLKAESFDLLSPLVGEICSGSLREDSHADLLQRCQQRGNSELLQWYHYTFTAR